MSESRSNTAAAYEKAQLGRRMGFGRKPAVVVIDLVNGFTDPAMPLGSDLSAVIAQTNRLLEKARSAGAPVIFTTIAYEANQKEGGLWLRKAPAQGDFIYGSPLIEVDERLARRPEEPVVVKKYASCFFGTTLSSLLAVDGVDTLVITGATTSGCVRATAVDALQSGYRPIVPRQCVGDRAEGPHQAALFDIDAKYGDVVDLEEVLAYLSDL